MEITVHGRHVEVPSELRKTAAEKVDHLGRYLEGMERAEIRFFEERNPRIAEPVGCEVTMSGHGHVVRARATGQEPHVALDRVVDKVSHRLCRLKERLVARSHPHHNGNHRVAGSNGRLTSADDLGDLPELAELAPNGAGGPKGSTSFRGRGHASAAEEGRVAELEMRIVRMKRFAIKPMLPAEAALQMELLSHDFFFFANAETGRPAVLYRRSDGDFGLIDAQ